MSSLLLSTALALQGVGPALLSSMDNGGGGSSPALRLLGLALLTTAGGKGAGEGTTALLISPHSRVVAGPALPFCRPQGLLACPTPPGPELV